MLLHRRILPKKGYSYGKFNQLIFNLKKPASRKNEADYKYKEKAIREVSVLLSSALKEKRTRKAVFVPVPTSKEKTDQEYDDRLLQVLNGVGPKLNIKEVIRRKRLTRPLHSLGPGGIRPACDKMKKDLCIDQEFASDQIPPCKIFVLFDDVRTTGAHFRVCHDLLREHFPDNRIIGLVVALSKWPDDEDGGVFDPVVV